MNRRSFLRRLVGGVGALVIATAVPIKEFYGVCEPVTLKTLPKVTVTWHGNGIYSLSKAIEQTPVNTGAMKNSWVVEDMTIRNHLPYKRVLEERNSDAFQVLPRS